MTPDSQHPAPFDKDAMLDNIGGDEDMLRMLLGLFLRTAEDVLAALDVPEAEKAGDAYTKLWQQQLHLLRGSALNIGAQEFCACLSLAEYEAESLSASQKSARLDLIKTVYADLRGYIEKITQA